MLPPPQEDGEGEGRGILNRDNPRTRRCEARVNCDVMLDRKMGSTQRGWGHLYHIPTPHDTRDRRTPKKIVLRIHC